MHDYLLVWFIWWLAVNGAIGLLSACRARVIKTKAFISFREFGRVDPV